MPVTRDEIIAKHATLDGTGAARFIGEYAVLVVADDAEAPLVTIQDVARDYVFRQHGHDSEPRDYVGGSWEALITA